MCEAALRSSLLAAWIFWGQRPARPCCWSCCAAQALAGDSSSDQEAWPPRGWQTPARFCLVGPLNLPPAQVDAGPATQSFNVQGGGAFRRPDLDGTAVSPSMTFKLWLLHRSPTAHSAEQYVLPCGRPVHQHGSSRGQFLLQVNAGPADQCILHPGRLVQRHGWLCGYVGQRTSQCARRRGRPAIGTGSAADRAAGRRLLRAGCCGDGKLGCQPRTTEGMWGQACGFIGADGRKRLPGRVLPATAGGRLLGADLDGHGEQG